MLKSMTGYGRAEETIEGRHIVFEIKSVNHKFFEFNSRLPRNYMFLEDRLKSFIKEKINRGKVDVFLQIDNLEESGAVVTVNRPLLTAYLKALGEIKEICSLSDEPSLALVSRFPDVLAVQNEPEDEDALWESVKTVAELAVSSFMSMRRAEGERLKADLESKAEKIGAMVSGVEERTPQTVSEYQKRLETKIAELLGDAHFDEQRVLTEVAIFADKVAVDEETVRLRSHLKQFYSLLESDEPVGRKIDFLIQEMNREANTIGSKSQNSEIAYLVVDMKAEIEKIREQVQNIE